MSDAEDDRDDYLSGSGQSSSRTPFIDSFPGFVQTAKRLTVSGFPPLRR